MKCRGIASSLPFSSPLVHLKRNPREFNSVSVEMHFCSKQSNLHSKKSKCFNFWWNAIVRLLITAAGAWEWECTRVTREIVGFQSGFVYHHTTPPPPPPPFVICQNFYSWKSKRHFPFPQDSVFFQTSGLWKVSHRAAKNYKQANNK